MCLSLLLLLQRERLDDLLGLELLPSEQLELLVEHVDLALCYQQRRLGVLRHLPVEFGRKREKEQRCVSIDTRGWRGEKGGKKDDRLVSLDTEGWMTVLQRRLSECDRNGMDV